VANVIYVFGIVPGVGESFGCKYVRKHMEKKQKSARPRRKSQAVVAFSAHASSGVTNLQQKTNFGLQCVRLQSRPVFCTRPRRILEKLFASENLSPMLNLV
jgi:hypothetical protein